MITFIHDGMLFCYTKQTLLEGHDVVGFYVADDKVMYPIMNESLYGSHIIAHSEGLYEQV